MSFLRAVELRPPIPYGELEKNALTLIRTLRLGQLALFATQGDYTIPTSSLKATFTERPDYAKGRQNGINGVTFHDLSLTRARETEPLTTQPVALKPYLSAFTASKDVTTMLDINRSPGKESFATFKPLGVLHLENGEYCTVTAFEAGVVSCDNILNKYRSRKLPEQQMRLVLSTALRTLLFLHTYGDKTTACTHGDPQLKNFAYGPNLDPRIIYTETFAKHDKANPDELPKFIRDIRVCAYAMSGERSKAGERLLPPEVIIENFLQPYAKQVPEIYPNTTAAAVISALEKLTKSIKQGE